MIRLTTLSPPCWLYARSPSPAGAALWELQEIELRARLMRTLRGRTCWVELKVRISPDAFTDLGRRMYSACALLRPAQASGTGPAVQPAAYGVKRKDGGFAAESDDEEKAAEPRRGFLRSQERHGLEYLTARPIPGCDTWLARPPGGCR